MTPRSRSTSRSTPSTTSTSSARAPMSMPSAATRAWCWATIDYALVPGLSNEVRGKLAAGPTLDGGAGGPDRRHDAGCARHPGRLSSPRGAAQRPKRRPPDLFHVKRAPLGTAGLQTKSDKAAALALIPVSRETEARLDRYLALLPEWQAKTNLVAPSTLPQLWTRHVADLLQLLRLAPSAKAGPTSAAAAAFRASCWLARWRRRRVRWSI